MSDLSRRTFTESLALAALGSALGVAPETLTIPAWTVSPGRASKPPKALAKALTQVIKAQYGPRLSARDLATIGEQIQAGLDRVERLKKVSLMNGDEPDFVFNAVSGSATQGG